MADKVRVAGVEYDMPTEMTIGEQLDITKALSALGFPPDASLGLAAGAVWIAVRRVHPKTTLEDLLAEKYEVIEGEPDELDALPPTNGAVAESDVTEPGAPTTTGTPPYGSTAEPSRRT